MCNQRSHCVFMNSLNRICNTNSNNEKSEREGKIFCVRFFRVSFVRSVGFVFGLGTGKSVVGSGHKNHLPLRICSRRSADFGEPFSVNCYYFLSSFTVLRRAALWGTGRHCVHHTIRARVRSEFGDDK